MTPEQIKSLVNTILSEDKSKKYFIHRTAIAPAFYDVSNGKLYTNREYSEMYKSGEKGYEYVDEFLYPIYGLEAEQLRENHVLDVGAGWTISEEEYKKTAERNFKEQISAFFEKGLYAVETSLDRTATSLEEGTLHTKLSIEEQRKRLMETLNEVGFGMNTSKGNNLLGALANREELNTLLILEIPDSCFGDLEHITRLFEKSDEVFETETAYRGVQKLDTIIPREYLKGAFYIGETDTYYNENEHSNSDRIIENGIYNRQTINEILSQLKNTEQLQGSMLHEVLDMIKSDFSVDNDVSQLKKRISIISELLDRVEDKDSIESLNAILEEIYEQIRNPIEKEYSAIEDLDFSQLSSDEIAKHIQDFVLIGSDTLRGYLEHNDYGNYFPMFEMYRKGLIKLSEDALTNISSDYRANNANAMVKGKIMDIERVTAISQQIEPFEEMELLGELGETDREKYDILLAKLREARERVCENSILNLEENAFLGGEIGKATINIPTLLKDQSRKHTEKDILEYEELMNGQAQSKDD